MSKAKNLGIFVVLVVAILITFGITKYANRSHSNRCTQDQEYSPEELFHKNQTKVVRLPSDLIPISYDLKLQPYMRPDQFYFTGNVLILVTCQNSTNKIILNANELDIAQPQIIVSKVSKENMSENRRLEVSNVILKDEVLTIELNKDLDVNGSYTIFIPFRGNLTTSLAGFYRSSYIDGHTNVTRYLAMTQFQATDARRAFPCWDEPAFKATFDIEITHWKNETAISNMPNDTFLHIDSDWARTKFQRTLKMSTYLVAYAIGEFAFEQQEQDVRPNFRIVARPSEIESAKMPILYGPKILKHFENYFNISFPLPKIDMLACPDFNAGAMENWGLITYREAYLLFDKKVSSAIQRYRVISVIAHELAHQWFGNLVTPAYWNDLWLNEGFATYVSYIGVDAVEPDWKIFDRFVLDEIHDVLSLDSLKNSHPISVEVHDPNEISELFDRISYAKSASIIRMMNHIIGEEAFVQGLRNYLIDFKFGNAEQSDLWSHLQVASDQVNSGLSKVNVKQVMDSWILKEGYPLITITRNYTYSEVKFSQKRFLLNSNDTAALMKTQYEVPISYTTKNEPDETKWKPVTKLWLHKTKNGQESVHEMKISISSNDWLIANLQQTGYYRVTYDEQNWNLLIKQLHEDHTKIHRINRAQILDDLFHLAENGVVKYETALHALEYLKKETDPLIWSSVGTNTYSINKMLRRTESYGAWQKYMRKLVQPGYDRFKLERLDDKNLEDNQMQRAVVSVACGYNLESYVESSQKLFKEFMNNPAANNIPPNVRPSVYCTAIAQGDEKEWNFVFQLYLREQNANERNTMLSALTCSRIPWIIVRYLKWMFDESSGIKGQDTIFVFRGVASQNYGKDIAFNFLRENWEQIYSTHGNKMSFSRIVKSLDSINSQFELDLVKSFYRSIGTKVGSAKRAFLQTIEQIESNILWMKRYESEIVKFSNEFEKNNSE